MYSNARSIANNQYQLASIAFVWIGTGKSFILNILRQVMEELDKAESITFTAPTGVAACNIRGMTVHSWAGIGDHCAALRCSPSRQSDTFCLKFDMHMLIFVMHRTIVAAKVAELSRSINLPPW